MILYNTFNKKAFLLRKIKTDFFLLISRVLPKKKVRYYIREYGDASSDNEAVFRK